jgi:hypothetical protein
MARGFAAKRLAGTAGEEGCFCFAMEGRQSGTGIDPGSKCTCYCNGLCSPSHKTQP